MNKYCACIVENRDIDIHAIIEKHKRFLSDEWVIIHNRDESVKSWRTYNELLTSISFWENLPCEKVLIFQHDSELLRCGIEDYLQYDFIGAQIKHIRFPMMNGGLSLRTKSKCIEVLEKYPYKGIHNEDMHFCEYMPLVGGILPTKEVAMTFSVETIFNMGSLGIHAPYKYLTPKQVQLIRTQYQNQTV